MPRVHFYRSDDSDEVVTATLTSTPDGRMAVEVDGRMVGYVAERRGMWYAWTADREPLTQARWWNDRRAAVIALVTATTGDSRRRTVSKRRASRMGITSLEDQRRFGQRGESAWDGWWWPRDLSGRWIERCTGPRSRCELGKRGPGYRESVERAPLRHHHDEGPVDFFRTKDQHHRGMGLRARAAARRGQARADAGGGTTPGAGGRKSFRPPTDKQIGYIKRLLPRTQMSFADAQQKFGTYTKVDGQKILTRGDASLLIADLERRLGLSQTRPHTRRPT